MRISRAPDSLRVSDAAPLVEGRPGISDVLDALDAGFNARSRVALGRAEPYTVPRVCFYAVVSKQGISPLHAAARVVSKGFSVAVFAFGTTFFAGAQLMSVAMVFVVLAVVLMSGLLGRISAMWMASQMNRWNQPVLHAVVRERTEAAKFVQEVVRLDGLQIEIGGHIVVRGRCVHRRTEWLNWVRYIGLLAPPSTWPSWRCRTTGGCCRRRCRRSRTGWSGPM